MDLTKLSNDEIISLYKEHFEESKGAQALLAIDIDAVDIYPVEYLKEKIKKFVSSGEFNKVYTTVTALTHKTYVKEEEIELLKIASKVKKGISDVKSDLKKVMDKYWWTSLGWEQLDPKFEQDFDNALREYLKDIKDPDASIKKSEEKLNKIKEERELFVSKYDLDREIQYLLELFDEYAYYHDLRKEMQVKVLYSFQLLLIETARRLNLNLDDLEWLWFDEVYELLKGGELDKEEVSRRKKAVYVLVSDGKVNTYSGDEAIKLRKKELEANIEKVVNIGGTSASTGIVRGKVKVCPGIKEALKKIEEGDILVCGMTMPDYVPVMKKAAAIVTDEGGITCHAAIVSRELGKPCITGTQIATSVLKDGDLVEVDADHGVVKILKRK
ncbi:hypothetical protein KY331_04265 [Candidatus Woesearchaeota archaeon]|nr:hypothetical protein [Candidatus Woesearchaeota archaeon]